MYFAKSRPLLVLASCSGRGGEIRIPASLLPKQVRYRTAHHSNSRTDYIRSFQLQFVCRISYRASRTCGVVRFLEELGGFDRHKIDYSQNAKKADGLGEIATSAFLSMI